MSLHPRAKAGCQVLVLLAVVVENSGHGGSIAAPLAGEVLRRLFLPDSLQNVRAVRAVPDTGEVLHAD